MSSEPAQTPRRVEFGSVLEVPVECSGEVLSELPDAVGKLGCVPASGE